MGGTGSGRKRRAPDEGPVYEDAAPEDAAPEAAPEGAHYVWRGPGQLRVDFETVFWPGSVLPPAVVEAEVAAGPDGNAHRIVECPGHREPSEPGDPHGMGLVGVEVAGRPLTPTTMREAAVSPLPPAPAPEPEPGPGEPRHYVWLGPGTLAGAEGCWRAGDVLPVDVAETERADGGAAGTRIVARAGKREAHPSRPRIED